MQSILDSPDVRGLFWMLRFLHSGVKRVKSLVALLDSKSPLRCWSILIAGVEI